MHWCIKCVINVVIALLSKWFEDGMNVYYIVDKTEVGRYLHLNTQTYFEW